MSIKAIANGSNEAERKAAKDANEVQDGVNLIAIVGAFHRHLVAMRDGGVCGDRLNNHPVSHCLRQQAQRSLSADRGA